MKYFNSNLPKSLDDIDFRIMNTFDLVDEVKLEMKAILTHQTADHED
jgi:hypothetical protein